MELSNHVISEDYFINKMDKNNITKDWILIASPYPVVTLLTFYLLFVFKIGPKFMKGRPAFEINTVLRVYDIFQVLHNLFMLSSCIIYPRTLPTLVTEICSLNEKDNYDDLKVVFLLYTWHFLVSKIIDLLDTVFLVVRNKFSQITVLHLYHHTMMVFFTWMTLSLTKSHHGVIPAYINMFVHVVMYSYYFLASFPQFKPYLWWKSHVTKLQLGQFVLILLYLFVIYQNGCPISPMFTYAWIFNVFIIFLFFVNFYIKAYISPSTSSKTSTEKKHT